MKKLYLDTKQKIYRATSIMFLVQLFGALGAGFFFVVQNILGTYHILGATAPDNESILWFICFWATDFFFIPFVLVISYLIAGIPAIAPSLTLGIYFCHFSSQSVAGADMYYGYYTTPAGYFNTVQGGEVVSYGSMSIGYMGYFIMAILLSFLIKYLYAGWTYLKNPVGRGFDNIIKKVAKKADVKGITIVEGVDLIVLLLILPVVSAVITFMLMKYGIQIPFAKLAIALGESLTSISASNVILSAIVMGLMVGFDLIGPVSISAFTVAVTQYVESGCTNAQLLTIYSVCFITVGWTAFFGVLCCKIFKKGTKTDTDDFNMTVSGPINAFFENIKLTTAFSMPYAYRSPLTVIPGLMAGSAVGGLLTALFKIENTAYTGGDPANILPKYAQEFCTYPIKDYTYAEILTEKAEIYLSFTLPLRSGDWLRCRIPLFVIILVSGFVGGLVIMALKMIENKLEKKHDCVFESNADTVIELRELGKKFAREVGKNYKDPAEEEAIVK